MPILRVTAIEPGAVTLSTGNVSLRRFSQRPGEVLVLRAGRDEVIPAANTDTLVASLPPATTQVVVIDGATHNDIGAFPAFGEALAGFMR